MKHVTAIITALLICSCITVYVFASAPVHPARGIYVSDHANILPETYRDFIMEISSEVYEQTGTQIVVLTVENLSGMEAEDYARLVLEGWQFEGYLDNDAALVLFSKDNNELYLAGSGELEAVLNGEVGASAYEAASVFINAGDKSGAVLEAYKAVIRGLYAGSGIKLENRIAERLNPYPKPEQTGGIFPVLIVFAAAVLLGFRSFRIVRKNQKRMANTVYYRRKDYRFTRRDFDEDDDNAIIEYEDDDK